MTGTQPFAGGSMRAHKDIAAAITLAATVASGWVANVSHAENQAKAFSPTAEGTPNVLPRPDFHFPGVGSPVDFTYQLPFKFTGNIDKVTVDLK
jgi:hypothetical protein